MLPQGTPHTFARQLSATLSLRGALLARYDTSLLALAEALSQSLFIYTRIYVIYAIWAWFTKKENRKCITLV